MKNKIYSRLLTTVVILGGLVGAFGTVAAERKLKPTVVMGYKHTPDFLCIAVKPCSNTGPYVCTAPDGSQLYGSNGFACIIPLVWNLE
jgi:hypothetical protein